MASRWFARRKDIPEDVAADPKEVAKRERKDTQEEIRKREMTRREMEITAKSETARALHDAGYTAAASLMRKQLVGLVDRMAELVEDRDGDSLEKDLLLVRMRALYELNGDQNAGGGEGP